MERLQQSKTVTVTRNDYDRIVGTNLEDVNIEEKIEFEEQDPFEFAESLGTDE